MARRMKIGYESIFRRRVCAIDLSPAVRRNWYSIKDSHCAAWCPYLTMATPKIELKNQSGHH